MLPVTALCLLAGSVAVSYGPGVAQALAVERGAVELRQLVELNKALHVLRSVAAFDVRFEQFGVTRAQATTAIGLDWGRYVAPARSEADRAMAALGAKNPVESAVVWSLDRDIDAGSVAPGEAVRRFDLLIGRSGRAVTRAFDRIDADAASPDLTAALQSLGLATGLLEFAPQQAIDLSIVWFPAPGDTPQASVAATGRLGADSGRYVTSMARLLDVSVGSVASDVARIEADPSVRKFDAAVASALKGEPASAPGTAIDPHGTSETFAGYFTRDALLVGLVSTATTAVIVEARDVAGTQRLHLVIWSFGAVALALASVIVALRIGRSISGPLKSLAAYAHAVNDGDLDAETSFGPRRGPGEIGVVVDVFAHLVENLQLLDAKANALAQCQFDNPVLREALPGRLGRSLENSVTVLSESIVQRDELQTHLAHQATHDALTGIANRPAAIATIEAAIGRAARKDAPSAVLFIDLNEFKTVNDSHGHEVGDEVLRQVAHRMSSVIRGGDFVARLGGDEFVVVSEGIAGVEEAHALAVRLVDTIGHPIDCGAQRVTVGAAVGIALTGEGPEDALRLLARADAAMYRAKHQERSAIEIFDEELQRQMLHRVRIEADLAKAFADPSGGGFRLQYQPVVDAESGALVGVEALIRWEHPEFGLLAPDSFIPIAEASSLIIDLDRWVLGEAIRQIRAWSIVPELADVPVAVNISGRHLLSGLLSAHIKSVLDDSCIEASRLNIEITETVLLSDLAVAASELAAVRLLGVRVAIDDFGTGYTSLAHLQQLPVDTIKIDRSFISRLGEKRGSSLVRMITDLGHAIDLSIVAEGVETMQERHALQEMGADRLQGYLLSRPLDPASLARWVGERRLDAWTCAPVVFIDDHGVHFYDTDAQIVAHVSDYLAEGLRAGDEVLFVAAPAHRAAVQASLLAGGLDLSSPRWRSLDADETLQAFHADGRCDEVAFDRVVGAMVRGIAAEGRPVRIYAEMEDLLWTSGDLLGAQRLEELWNALRADVPFGLLCGYRSGSDRGERVVDLHSHLVST